jgi:hypothetical protein
MLKDPRSIDVDASYDAGFRLSYLATPDGEATLLRDHPA